jgi:predicted DNA-binding mobile mystery protein A
MVTAAQQLDRRLDDIRRFAEHAAKPPRGWIRAIRDALGMTTSQLAKRMGVTQPRISELERAEAGGNVGLQSLERAAQAMGCRLVYALVPLAPLSQTIQERAERLADRDVSAVEQSMKLEDQSVEDPAAHAELRRRIVDELIRSPSRLWNSP